VHSTSCGAWRPVSEIRELLRHPLTISETKGALAKTMIPVPLFDLAFLMRIRASWCRNAKPAALGTERKQTLAGLSNPK
jgi:hypothetical protein